MDTDAAEQVCIVTSVLWPGYTWRFRKVLKTFDPTDYEFAVASTAEPSAVAS